LPILLPAPVSGGRGLQSDVLDLAAHLPSVRGELRVLLALHHRADLEDVRLERAVLVAHEHHRDREPELGLHVPARVVPPRRLVPRARAVPPMPRRRATGTQVPPAPECAAGPALSTANDKA